MLSNSDSRGGEGTRPRDLPVAGVRVHFLELIILATDGSSPGER